MARKSKPKEETPWEFLVGDFNVKDYAGFVYYVRNNTTGKVYIGKKFFWSTTRKRVKGKKRRVRTTKESTWRYYKGSSEELLKDIKELGVSNFEFAIMSVHKTKGATNYNETKQLFLDDVLYAELKDGSPMFYNKNILGRYFRGIDG